MNQGRERGVTLLEMMIVAGLIGLMAAITFPALNSGIDSLRLRSATDGIVSHLTSALNRTERRQLATEVAILRQENVIRFASADNGYRKELEMPDGVTITAVEPQIPGLDPMSPRVFLLHPGGVIPRILIEVTNRRGFKRRVSVDPITGTAQIERVQQ
jgi:prepilin-type N-terminal cleavage/methylation domain-containing protein